MILKNGVSAEAESAYAHPETHKGNAHRSSVSLSKDSSHGLAWGNSGYARNFRTTSVSPGYVPWESDSLRSWGRNAQRSSSGRRDEYARKPRDYYWPLKGPQLRMDLARCYLEKLLTGTAFLQVVPCGAVERICGGLLRSMSITYNIAFQRWPLNGTMAITTVGYIGLGKAGASMASNLPRAGFKLIVRDADPEREQHFASTNKHTTVAEPGSDGFKDVEVIVTMLPQGKVVRDALLGENGIAKGLKKDSIIIDTSSSSPFDTRSLGADLEAQGLILIDSPVTQAHLHDTDTGDATLMVGSNSSDAVSKAMPVLQAMAKYVFHMGNLGAGHAMKTLNNYVSGASIVALSDALVAGQKFGLDPIQMIDVLNVGTGKNFSTSDSYKTDALPRRYASGFQLALLIKDIGIAKEVFEHEKFETDMPDLIIRYFKEAMDQVAPDADHTELLKSWEKRAGIELKQGTPDGSTVTALKQ